MVGVSATVRIHYDIKTIKDLFFKKIKELNLGGRIRRTKRIESEEYDTIITLHGTTTNFESFLKNWFFENFGATQADYANKIQFTLQSTDEKITSTLSHVLLLSSVISI
jgi:hypothetical protein